MAVQQQQQLNPLEQTQQPQQPQWQPTLDKEKTRRTIKAYQQYPHRYKEEQLEEIRKHAQYHNVPFYEGEFSIFEAIKQAGGGFIEGFTTLRVADPPDNEWEAVARNVGHLAGFVPGILSGPLKALGIMTKSKMIGDAAMAVGRIKSVPMLAADAITKRAKKIIAPALKGAIGSRFKAAETASKFFLKDKAAHMIEGAFHLGTASAVSSVWDGVDQMMHSFVGGAAAGGVFRLIGNVVPGTKTGDKVIKGLAGSLFMGLPSTIRGATTPEQIYEYLAGAYFGGKETPWYHAKANEGILKFREQMKTNPKFEAERQVKDMDGFDEYPEIVQNKMIELGVKQFNSRKQNLAMAEEMMAQHGILDRIPKKEWTTTGYKALSAIRKGIQRRTRYQAHDDLGAAASGAAEGADSLWSLEANKFGFPTIHMIPETFVHKKTKDKFFEDLKAGKIKGVDRGVSEIELAEAGPALEEANLTLKRGEINNYKPWAYQLLARNYFQIKGANSLFAVAPLEQGKKTVKGGTGWAVQMALDKGLQEVYVYDPTKGNKTWFKWTPEVNRFKAIDFTPKLRRNPALVGSRQINPGGEGHQAIRDVMEVTFGKVKKGPKSPIAGALKEDEIKVYHQKTLENIKDIEKQISEKRDHLKDIKSDLKDAKLGKVRMKELKIEEKETQVVIDKLYKDVQFKHRALEPTQYIDMTSGFIVNDIDTGMQAQSFSLMKKGEYFSNTHLKDLWDEASTIQSKRDSMLNFGKIVETTVRNYVKKNDKNVDITKAVEDLEKTFGRELSDAAKLDLRKWMRELNLGRQVIHIKTTGGAKDIPGFTNPGRPTNQSGMTVRQVESPKVIEEVYKNEGGKLETGKSPSALVILDTVGRINKRGFRIDVPLNKLATHIQFAEKKPDGKRYSEDEALAIVQNVQADIIKKLLKSDNLYPFGGQGDKGRVVFVKLHPRLKGMSGSNIHLAYLNLIKTIRRNIKKNKIDNQALLMLNRHRKAMESGYGIKPKDFEKMVVSNLMYDLSLNGYKYSQYSIAKIMKPGFIGNAVAFNKRHQIWMTNGYSGSKDYIKNAVDENGKQILDDLSPRDNLKYRLIDDPTLPDDLKKKVLEARSSQLGEDVDGAILSRDDTVELLNKDAGHPDSGQQKSFIVDNTPEYTSLGEVNKGALLGKYMIHNVGPEASKDMKDAGIHFLIMKSAAKQTGERITGKYDVGGEKIKSAKEINREWVDWVTNKAKLGQHETKDLIESKKEFADLAGYKWNYMKNDFKAFKGKGGLVLTGGRTYELNPESIKYSTSVVQDEHMAQKQIWVKQLFTNLHTFSKEPIPKEVIDDIHKEVIGKAFKGNKLFNDVLLEYKMTKDPEKINFLVENLEELGTAELIETLKTPGAERFAEVALQKMLRIVESDIESQYQDGTLSSEQRSEAIRHFTEAVSPIDRLLKNSAIVGEEANIAGETGYPAYMHKFVRDYRQAVLHNYFVKTITRPKQDNSLLARMRPYDKWMQRDFKELDKDDTIFYLDEKYRDTRIKLDNGKKKKLGWLWDTHGKDPKYAKYFDALVLRVPMDSISGAHKLKFKGFTGRNGHGVMLNSKTMRALAGADLDGDEAFVYFGGKNEDGTGYGMKKSWMDSIHANKSEYYNKTGNHVEDNKQAFIQHGPHKGKRFSEVLAVGTGGINPLKESKALYYSPLARLNASQGAYSGRDLLGRIVTHSQVMKSTFSALMEASDKKDVFVMEKGYGKKKQRFRVTITPKDGEKDLAYQREMTRAQTAFASDPMDEVALREYDHFFNTLHDSYFNKSFEVYNRKTKRYELLKGMARPIKPIDIVKNLPTAIGTPVTQKSGVTHYSKAYSKLSNQYPLIRAIIRDTGRDLWGKTTAWYGAVDYQYSGALPHPAREMPKEFQQIASSLEKRLAQKKGYFNSALVNVMPKSSALGAHQDYENIFHRTDKTTGKVATITLGAGPTEITIRKGYKGKGEVVKVSDGDLYVMPGKTFQANYTHQVGEVPGERISLTFRHIPKNVLKKAPSGQVIIPSKVTVQKPIVEEQPDNIRPSDFYGSNLRGGKSLLGAFKNMNSAYFGRNWSEGRRHSMDEVNYLASDIGILNEAQKNTILPKMVDTLEGLDWSDNLFNRVDRKSIEKTYDEIQAVLDDKGNRFGTWLKDAMNRSTFAVVYNDHIKAVVLNKLNDRHVRHKIALKDDIPSLREFRRIVKHSIWGKEFEQKAERLAKLYSYEERLKILEQMHRQAEDFLSNDVATMATIKAVDRILKKHRMNAKVLSKIHSAVSKFKARSYLSRRELGQLDYDAFSGSQKDLEDMNLTNYLMTEVMGKKQKQQDLIGDKRSATWDQMQLDSKMRQYKDGLKNDAERELFDHLFIGTLNRGDMHKVNRLINNLPSRKHTPMFRELMSRIIKETARTTQSRLALNSEVISPISIQNHLKSMNQVFSKMWKPSTKESLEGTTIGVENVINESGLGEESLMDKLVMGAHKGKGYAGIKKGEVSKEDKAVITEIATMLKRYNNKVEGALPDLNEQMRGMTSRIDPQGMGKDLNTFNKEDFILVRNYLRELESGTIMQKIRKASENPEIMKEYYSYFPQTTNRELMAYDILWLKKKQWYLTKGGKIEEGYVRKPTYFLEMLMHQAHKNNSLATGKAEVLAKDIEQQFINLDELKEGTGLFQIAIAQAELGNKDDIDARQDLQDIIKKHYKLNYDVERTLVEKEFNWKKLKDKDFTVLNDENKRIQATGMEIVNGNKKKNLTGIKKKVADRFESLYELIVGDKVSINKYKTGKYFDPDLKLQPKLNWTLFVKDMEKAFEKGDDIPMQLGIDGMRHLMRSMMYDLAETNKQRSTYANWIIKETGKIDFAKYWPHMFFDKRTAELNMKKTLDFIRNDSSLTEEQKKQALANLILRHKTVTGDWEFQDMQDWDRVDVMEINETLKEIARKKKEKHEVVKWTDMNSRFSSMMSRKGHIGGWSKDMNVMNAYVRNLTGTYYRQINQIMSRKTIHDAKKRMTKKFGARIAKNWDRYFKLYVQGAMGQPDVIPKTWYDDPDMKLKGTPYAWFADNRVLDRVNKIRERLGIRESDLPKELKDFDYRDIRHWSNMEAKFELATLLAHPKTAITNIFGGSLHTIQSVGHKAFLKARNIKFLKRINPSWNSLQDVEEFVVRKGVVPEFMIHELGLGQEVKTVRSIESFIGELSSKINSPDEISRKEIRSLGKKYRLSDRIVSKASKFMSIPERTLRRDAFMAHYIRAWERFGGAITDPEHPFLIEMGKKGVKATQFLYEAPNRPFFARTALGKIMSRFQLFAWNSWRFRNDVVREGRRYGFKEGTEAGDRFARTMQIDLFVLALGNMFLYSLFDNALPQPWGWFQDTADWIFGDERERERAFFGAYPGAIAPLQIITPPLARFPVSGLMQWARDDYTKFSEYQVYTMFPFGRMIRDVVQPNKGLIDNPSRLLEKLAGMPLRDIQRFSTERRKKIEEGKRYIQPKVGF